MDDLISRQAAIEALHDEIVSRRISEDTNDDGALDEFDTEAILRRLPSAQPDLQQTCNQLATDTISRQAAIDESLRFIVEYYGAAFDEEMQVKLKRRLESLPSAQPERKTGEWIYDGDSYKCNKCGAVYGWWADSQTSNFCPNCGANMRGEAE